MKIPPLLASLLLVAPLLAAGQAMAGNWTVDQAASHVGFSGMQTGQPFKGEFKRFTAAIAFDPAQPQAGHVDVTVDMTSAVTGDPQRDTALPQPEWFDAKKFATATFHADGFVPKGGDAFEAHGRLTVRGVGVDVVLPFRLAITGATAHATGHTQLVRTALGVGQGPWADDQYVALEVGVDVEVAAHADP